MTIELSPLPYAKDALEPYVSANTLSFHYDRHHRGYVDKLNTLVDGTDYEGKTLEEIIAKSRTEGAAGIYNNAAQVWNHAFLWESMSPGAAQSPRGRIRELIDSSFGDVDAFNSKFLDAALAHFGSGWVWLALDGDALRIYSTSNADTPVETPAVPLLTLDVWEHAYYLDYQNDRKTYVETFLEHLVNWEFAAANLDKEGVGKAA